LHRIVEFRILAAVVRIRIQLLVDTFEVVVDTVLVAGIVEVLEMDTMSAQEQQLELDTDWVLRQQSDTGLMLEECRKVDLRYILLCFPHFCSYFCSCCYYRKKQTHYRCERYLTSSFQRVWGSFTKKTRYINAQLLIHCYYYLMTHVQLELCGQCHPETNSVKYCNDLKHQIWL